jgi:hypothetical protein
MKQSFLIPTVFAVVAAGTSACQSSDPSPQAPTEHVGMAQERQIGLVAPAAFSVWPAGPIAFDGSFATMPLAIWSPNPLGFLAFDIPGCTGLTLGFGAFGADGAFVANSAFTAMPISTAFLGGIQAGLVPGIAPIGLAGPALLPAGALAAPLLTSVTPASFLNPFISSNALMFTGIPAIGALSPVIVNVGFAWPGSLNFSAINVFAASADATSAFMSASTASFAASTSIAAANSLAFTNMLFPLTFTPAIGALPASLFW